MAWLWVGWFSGRINFRHSWLMVLLLACTASKRQFNCLKELLIFSISSLIPEVKPSNFRFNSSSSSVWSYSLVSSSSFIFFIFFFSIASSRVSINPHTVIMLDTIDNMFMKIVVGVSPKKRNNLFGLLMASFNAGSESLSSGWIFSKKSKTTDAINFHCYIMKATRVRIRIQILLIYLLQN